MTDHTPSPATDGLREAIEALADAMEAGRWPTRPRGGVVDDLRALLAAHPALLADPAPEAAREGHVVHVTAAPIAEDVVWCDECEEWVSSGAPERETPIPTRDPGPRSRVCMDPDCTIPRKPGFPMHGPHDLRAATPADLPVATGVTTEDERREFHDEWCPKNGCRCGKCPCGEFTDCPAPAPVVSVGDEGVGLRDGKVLAEVIAGIDGGRLADASMRAYDACLRAAEAILASDWLAARVAEAGARAWDEAVRECHDLGWLHDYARSDAIERNPYREATQ